MGDKIANQFRKDTAETNNLLRFLIREGHPYRIPDQLIADLQDCLALANPKDNTTPPKGSTIKPDDLTKLMKVRRDLIAIPQINVTFDRIPPTPFFNLRSPWFWIFAAYIITIAILTIFCYTSNYKYWYMPFFTAPVAFLVFWAFYVFTGVATNKKLNQCVIFAYIFTISSLLLSIVPFCFYGELNPDLTDAPIAVLRGCKLLTLGSKASEVSCGDSSSFHQWVLNIGGSVIHPYLDYNWSRGSMISGGIVVPLYVIVLSFFGSAISMTRRIPEYQRRAMDALEPLTNVQAREDIVFQIMQVLSAPLIAVTAYEIVAPSDQMTSVVLAFGSGFASEPILLMIRSLVEKLSPTPQLTQNSVNARVSPAAVLLKPGDTQQFSLQIAGAPNAAATWQIRVRTH